MEQIALASYVLLYVDLTTEDLFYCTPTWSETCMFFCQQFLSFVRESAEGNSEHDLAGLADQADGTIVLTLLEVAFL